MARKAMVKITVADGTCGDGCGVEVNKGRRFKQGHDAKLRSIVIGAHKEGRSVKINTQVFKASTWLELNGYPVPTVKEAKAA